MHGIYAMINKVDDKTLQDNIRQLHDTASKIIDTISKNPGKLDKTQSFFDYYLPVTLKILEKYDMIENQRMDNEETKKFMTSAENMISKINKSFKVQLSNLYQSDIIDTDAEMKVFETMLKSDGFTDIEDFNIKK
jgi:5-bromo-4-chloroindolyl phosphate hydrolysis protein